MVELKEVAERVSKIEERNRRVEKDKTWEVSWARRIVIALLTYISTGLYLWAIEVSHPWLNSIGATAGFLLSTLSIPIFRKLWERYIYRGKN